MEIKILSVNKSEHRGRKFPYEKITIKNNGVEGDVHAGSISRQVSILDISHVEQFRKLAGARETEFGEFAENLTVKGLDYIRANRLDRFVSETLELEVTTKGKPFHDKFREIGNYVMPREGIFCRVIKPGEIKKGDILTYVPKVFQIKIITLSDRASTGEYEDRSGPKIREMIEAYFDKIRKLFAVEIEVIPDDKVKLKKRIKECTDDNVDVIFTTGGTGIGPRDITVETIKPMLHKELPGVMEMIRLKYGMEKPNALLSNGVAGVINKSLIYTLPGSVKAVTEYITEITKTLEHAILMLHGIDAH